MDYSSYYPKNMLEENELEKQHILQTLADKDINAKFTGKKSFVVHKDNVTKAKAHLKKIGMHNDYVVTHDTSMNEEVVEESSIPSADYKISKNGRKYPASRISFKDFNKKQDADLKESFMKSFSVDGTKHGNAKKAHVAALNATGVNQMREITPLHHEVDFGGGHTATLKTGEMPSGKIKTMVVHRSVHGFNESEIAELEESVSVKYEYQDDGKHIAHVNTKDKDGNTESHSYAANDKGTLQKHIKKTHSTHMKSDNDMGGFKQKTEHEFIEDNSSSAAKGKTVKTIGGLKVRTTK